MSHELNNKKFPVVRVAAVQAEHAYLQLDESIAKCVSLIDQAGKENCDLIVFPESYLPGYPGWYVFKRDCAFSSELDRRLYLNSISLQDKGMKELQRACASNGINAVLGLNETEPGVIGTMYNCQVYVTRDGEIAGKHQKYVPTFSERLPQAPGTTGYINSFQTDFGTVSSLICGENSNPLGVYAASTAYPVVHCAAWPHHFGPNTDMHRIIRMCTAAVAYTLKCFVVNAVSRISEEYLDMVVEEEESRQTLQNERARKRGACIMDPFGRMIACGDGEEEELLIAELNLQECIQPKIFQDYAGHYTRQDIFAPLFEKYIK